MGNAYIDVNEPASAMSTASSLSCSTVLTEMHVQMILELFLTRWVIRETEGTLFALNRKTLVKHRNVLRALPRSYVSKIDHKFHVHHLLCNLPSRKANIHSKNLASISLLSFISFIHCLLFRVYLHLNRCFRYWRRSLCTHTCPTRGTVCTH